MITINDQVLPYLCFNILFNITKFIIIWCWFLLVHHFVLVFYVWSTLTLDLLTIAIQFLMYRAYHISGDSLQGLVQLVSCNHLLELTSEVHQAFFWLIAQTLLNNRRQSSVLIFERMSFYLICKLMLHQLVRM